MFRDHTVGVVIPAYNESGFVGEVMETIPAFVDRIYVIDDRSVDDTWAEITGAASRLNEHHGPLAVADGGVTEPRFVPIRHERNRGRGAAVKTGYRAALAEDLEVVAVLDGDGQMDPDLLERFIAPVVAGEVDYTKGNRLNRLEHLDGMSRWRFVGNILLTILTRLASGYWRMKDSQNGYTAISAAMLHRLDLDGIYDGYGFLNDILVKLHVEGAQIGDVIMPARYGNEQSGIRYRSFIPRLSALLVRNFAWRLWREHRRGVASPYPLLYALGGLLAMGGTVVSGWAVLGEPSTARLLLGPGLWLLGALVAVRAIAHDRLSGAHLVRRLDAWHTDRAGDDAWSETEATDHPL